jgi:hypothetical protein
VSPEADGAADAARIARGPTPGDLVARHGAPRTAASAADSAAAPYDPLRLCIYATIAALGWLLGPLALTIFAAVAFAGYWRAWRGGLQRSRCWLRDTRLVLLYLGLLALAGIAGVVWFAVGLFG